MKAITVGSKLLSNTYKQGNWGGGEVFMNRKYYGIIVVIAVLFLINGFTKSISMEGFLSLVAIIGIIIYIGYINTSIREMKHRIEILEKNIQKK